MHNNKEKLLNILKIISPFSEVYEALTLEEAINTAGAVRIDVLFSETSINENDPYEILKEIKVFNPRVNIIFYSDSAEYMSKAFLIHASGYIINPLDQEKVKEQLSNLLYPSGIEIVTFGNFCVYVNGTYVKFRRSKSREALAFLVDRGTPCTKKQIAACIFEDHVYDRSYQKYTDNILRALISDLKNAGAGELIVHTSNCYSVNKNICICDYYDYLQGKRRKSYIDEYMSQYSWAEDTLALLRYKKD